MDRAYQAVCVYLMLLGMLMIMMMNSCLQANGATMNNVTLVRPEIKNSSSAPIDSLNNETCKIMMIDYNN